MRSPSSSALELVGEGTDTVETSLASASLVGLANVENLTGTSAGGQALTGNAGTNVITAAGSGDILTGGAGAGTSTGRASHDRFIYAAGLGADIITDFVAGAGTDDWIDVPTLENLRSAISPERGPAGRRHGARFRRRQFDHAAELRYDRANVGRFRRPAVPAEHNDADGSSRSDVL